MNNLNLIGWKEITYKESINPELKTEVIKVTLFSKNHLNMGTKYFIKEKCH